MTLAKLRQLQRMHAAGDGPNEIAAALGVGRTTVYRHLTAHQPIATGGRS